MTTFHHQRQLRILFAADYFARGTRDANKIATVSGLNVTELFDLCETPEWRHALKVFGYEGSPSLKNRDKHRRRKRRRGLVKINENDLPRAERVWHELLGLRPESSFLRRQLGVLDQHGNEVSNVK